MQGLLPQRVPLLVRLSGFTTEGVIMMPSAQLAQLPAAAVHRVAVLGRRVTRRRAVDTLTAESQPEPQSEPPAESGAAREEVLSELVLWLQQQLPRLFLDGVGATEDGMVSDFR